MWSRGAPICRGMSAAGEELTDGAPRQKAQNWAASSRWKTRAEGFPTRGRGGNAASPLARRQGCGSIGRERARAALVARVDQRRRRPGRGLLRRALARLCRDLKRAAQLAARQRLRLRMRRLSWSLGRRGTLLLRAAAPTLARSA